MRREALPATGEAEPIGRRSANRDPLGVDADGTGKSPPHLVSVRRDRRLLADEDAVGVRELVPGARNLVVRAAKEVDGRRAAPRRIARREERSDVAEARRPEEGVDERVGEHVAVGVPGEPAGMLDADAAENERHAVGESVRVEAEADPVVAQPLIRGSGFGHPSGSIRRCRPSNIATVP